MKTEKRYFWLQWCHRDTCNHGFYIEIGRKFTALEKLKAWWRKTELYAMPCPKCGQADKVKVCKIVEKNYPILED